MLRQTKNVFLDLLYPKNCHICSKILKGKVSIFDDNLCWECAYEMKKSDIVSCSFCGCSLSTDNELIHLSCGHCRKNPPYYERLISCYSYEGTTRELVHKFKYGNRPYLAKTITKLMIEAMEGRDPTIFSETDCFMPVPLHPVRLREREFNQSELIAKELSGQFRKPLDISLRRIKNTQTQVALHGNERFANLKNAFALAEPCGIKGKNILLIDDVVTTGATTQEASKTLKKSGAKNISIMAFAKG